MVIDQIVQNNKDLVTLVYLVNFQICGFFIQVGECDILYASCKEHSQLFTLH
jgi:hypothetical protein